MLHQFTTNEDIASWLDITPYEAHILMHAINEAYVIHSRKFTDSVLRVADTLMDRLGISSVTTKNDVECSFVERYNRDIPTLIFNWTDHKFYISALNDFIEYVEAK